MSARRILSLWAPVAAFMGLLYVLSSQQSFPVAVHGWDKGVHVGVYTVLGVLALRACHGGLDWLGPKPTLLAVGLTLAYGLVDELHQSRVPRRVPSVGDWLADAVGALLAVVIVALTLLLRSRLAGPGAARPER